LEAKADSDHERSERERKQTYLKNEIISKGYHKAEFANYMTSLKANGTDIDIWGFDELVHAVETFKANQSSNI